MADFLPLCDLLFNVASMAAYFCDLVFGLLLVHALYQYAPPPLFCACLLPLLLSALLTQALSLRWYLATGPPRSRRLLAAIAHLLQLGVLWRYARLLAPVSLPAVKREVRDLCVLRLVHGFVQAAPLLLLELHILERGVERVPEDLVTVSAALSLFSVCWGLASFSKHVRKVDRLILTWLGVLSQLFWRLGTVTSRFLSLSAYAAAYRFYIFLVLLLHFSCTLLWLLLRPNPAKKRRKPLLCLLLAFVYVFAYVNLHRRPHVRAMAIFYVVMLLENCLLVGAWLAAVWHKRPAHWELVPILTIALFAAGVAFMVLYYRFFHVKRLLTKPSTPPGVFNCRFAAPSAALYRKKKKPTSFVPPPPPPVPFWRRPLPSSNSENEGSSVGSRVNIHQKLQEKKQKQLAELKIIEEEIKQGKLVGPEGADLDDRQPIPRAKRHVEPHLLSLASLNNLASYGVNLNRRPPPRAPRSRTPELLLAPRYLYCDCGGVQEPELVEGSGRRTPSDLESQVSLPRSYTLPREFKYYRRQRAGRPVQTVASTNSSDGDVDSADDESDCNPPTAMVRQLRRPFRHETKL